ncbi:fibroblast growth factor receptor 2-like [Dendronephthya gigantea]|uniref:fibroblast growth factor receptor 2-like n=1 Tax=Dendronephthya gigantea TaxID=151771 RepID=UPI00106C709C|nr:fibroblast growth factor receptor 2-like [Dendronephthya gigantea]XP_028414941.1 fibroblast growth factor receptor 2-like [Dendronephthya gigantea]XP_028414942.1 fibroblast growth factor receptor 2-like [Dendronephthya gigantea]
MWFPLARCDQFILILLYLTCWFVCEGTGKFFKDNDQEPEIVYAVEGARYIRLTCSVKLDSAKNRWYKDGQLIKAQLKKYWVKKNKYLKIANITKSDQGIYVCQAFLDKEFENKTIYLDVIENSSGTGIKPYFTNLDEMEKKREVEYDEQNKPTFSCKARGSPMPDVMWFKNDEIVQHKSGEISSKNFVYKVKSPDVGDPIKYKCLVWNKVGNISFEFTLKVPKTKIRSAPIIQQIGNQTAVVGTQFKVRCDALAHQQPRFKLQHISSNGSVVPVKIGGRIKMGPIVNATGTDVHWYSVTWTFENVSFSDQKTYACTAENFIKEKREYFSLTVKRKEYPTSDSTTDYRVNRGQERAVDITIIAVVSSLGFAIVLVIVVCAMCLRRRRRTRGARFVPSKDDIYIVDDVPEVNNHPIVRKFRTRFSSNLSQASEIPYDDDWDISRENVRLLGTIGEGAFGTVLKAEAYIQRLGAARLTVAVKTLKDDATDVEFADLVSELEVMKKIGPHKNIINLIGCCTQNGPLLVIVEYAPHGNLREYLRERRPQREEMIPAPQAEDILSLRDFISFSYQVARGMEYLASMRCIHRDLAARNVLVGDDKIMKIADFGLARDIHKIDYYRKTTDGRLPVKWMALEALFDRVYTTQSDVWAFGVLAWEIFTFGGTPYPSVPLEKLFELLKSGYRMERPVNCPPELYDLLLRCWLEEPGCRPNFTEIVRELNEVLEGMTTEEYVDIEAPLLSPMTPRTLSESGPNHGLNSVRTYFGNEVFASDENDADDDEEGLLSEDCESDKIFEEKSSDSGLVESEGNSEEGTKVEDENSILLVDGSEKPVKFRVRKESHV